MRVLLVNRGGGGEHSLFFVVGKMEGAILNLEREFQRLVGELEFHAHRLEKDWGSEFHGAHNPIKLFKRIKGLERQLPELQKMHRANLQAKQEAVACLPHMLSNIQTLSSLKESIGFVETVEADSEATSESDGTSVESDCEVASNLIAAWKEEIAAGRTSLGSDLGSGGELVDAEGSVNDATSSGVLQESLTANVPASVLPAKKLTGAAKMLEWETVSMEDFKQLPASVRGRCKKKDVDQVYSLVRAHFEPFLANNILAARGNEGIGNKAGRRKKRMKKAAPLTITMLNGQGGKVRRQARNDSRAVHCVHRFVNEKKSLVHCNNGECIVLT